MWLQKAIVHCIEKVYLLTVVEMLCQLYYDREIPRTSQTIVLRSLYCYSNREHDKVQFFSPLSPWIEASPCLIILSIFYNLNPSKRSHCLSKVSPHPLQHFLGKSVTRPIPHQAFCFCQLNNLFFQFVQYTYLAAVNDGFNYKLLHSLSPKNVTQH